MSDHEDIKQAMAALRSGDTVRVELEDGHSVKISAEMDGDFIDHYLIENSNPALPDVREEPNCFVIVQLLSKNSRGWRHD